MQFCLNPLNWFISRREKEGNSTRVKCNTLNRTKSSYFRIDNSFLEMSAAAILTTPQCITLHATTEKNQKTYKALYIPMSVHVL